MSVSIFPKNKSTSFLNGFVFDCLIVSLITAGLFGLSTEISDRFRCTLGSYAMLFGTTISPILKKPKNAMQQAAHNIGLFGIAWLEFHTFFIALNRSGKIGSRSLDFPLSILWQRFTPRRTYWRRVSPGRNG